MRCEHQGPMGPPGGTPPFLLHQARQSIPQLLVSGDF